MAIVSLAFAGCAAYPLAQDESLSEAATVSGYPGPTPEARMPTPRPLPTLPDGSPNPLYSYFATPAPDEKVAVIDILEISPIVKPERYSIEGETTDKTTGRTALYVFDTLTGDKVRLGDDAGTAILETVNEEHVVWFFLCEPCKEHRNGLYVYTFESGQNTLIAEKFMSTVGSVKLAGPWVTYLHPQNPDAWAAQLFVYNLQTGKTIRVSDDVFYANFHTSDYVAVNEDMVAWVSIKETMWDKAIKVYDLTTQKLQQVEVQVKNPRELNVSRDVVVWWDTYWKGYDLKRDVLFTIPVLPPGWENVGVQQDGPVTAKGDQLYWLLKVNEQDYYFTARFVPAQEKSGALDPLPTPLGAPTSILLEVVEVPASTTPPTAYP